VGLGYLPGPFLPFNLAGFAPLLAWLDDRTGPDRGVPGGAAGRLEGGFAFGWTVHLVALHFMYSMLAQSWLAALLYLGMSAAVGLRIALSVALAAWLRRRLGLSFGLLLPLSWLPLEWAQTFGDLRMTGEHLAHTLSGYPFLVQFADVTGPYGVGALLLSTNGLVYEVMRGGSSRSRRRAAGALAALWVIVLAYGAWAWNRVEPPGPTLRVALIQPDISLAVKHAADSSPEQWRVLAELTRRAAAQSPRPDLIVWPESARPDPLLHFLAKPETYAMPDVQGLAREVGVPILLGVEYARLRAPGDYALFNAVLAADADGRLLEQWTAKTYLVPFVEATPFRGLLGPLVEGRGGAWSWLAGGFTPAPSTVVFELAGARIGALVCYEEFFPDLSRALDEAGAELQVVITNDAWFGRSLFQPYLVNALRLRAIEGRTSFVRVANTGISGFVDWRGRYALRTPLFEPAVETRDVRRSTQRTVYHRAGDVVAWLAVAGLLAAAAAARWRGGGDA